MQPSSDMRQAVQPATAFETRRMACFSKSSRRQKKPCALRCVLFMSCELCRAPSKVLAAFLKEAGVSCVRAPSRLRTLHLLRYTEALWLR